MARWLCGMNDHRHGLSGVHKRVNHDASEKGMLVLAVWIGNGPRMSGRADATKGRNEWTLYRRTSLRQRQKKCES